jgi:hypothetical protein
MPGVDLLDVYGPLEMLYYLSMSTFLNLTIITPTEENVVIAPELCNRFNSIFSPEFVGSATIHDDLDLDVLMVPGGSLHLAENLTYIDDFLVKMKPRIDYLISICTGAIYPARAGLLNGRRATTNKAAWNDVTNHGQNVTWVAPARFVIDGDIWSSSGVSMSVRSLLKAPWLITDNAGLCRHRPHPRVDSPMVRGRESHQDCRYH